MKRPRSFHFIPAKKKRKLFISLFPIDARDINSEEKNTKRRDKTTRRFFFFKNDPRVSKIFIFPKAFIDSLSLMLIKVSQRAENNS